MNHSALFNCPNLPLLCSTPNLKSHEIDTCLYFFSHAGIVNLLSLQNYLLSFSFSFFFRSCRKIKSIMKSHIKIAALAVCFAIIFVSCGNRQSSVVSYEMSNLEFTLDTPAFAGPNTFQAHVVLNLDDLLKSKGVDASKIESVKMTEGVFNATSDSATFNNFSDLQVQFAGSNTDMAKVALINTVAENATSLKVTIADEAKLTDYFKKETELDVVIDANLKEAPALPVKFSGNLTFEITLKP